MPARTVCHTAIALLAAAISPAALGVVSYSESSGGDLSNNQAVPTPVTLVPGANSVIGSVRGSTDLQDWVVVTVPAGFQLSSYVLAAYSSSDVQGFTGLQAGTSFVGDPFSGFSYLGYAHFGTAAVNFPLPPTNLVGQDLLPLMGDSSIAVGSLGFTPPLPAGSYTFLIQQLGSITNYTFDFGMTPVPSPGIPGLAIAAGMLAARRRR